MNHVEGRRPFARALLACGAMLGVSFAPSLAQQAPQPGEAKKPLRGAPPSGKQETKTGEQAKPAADDAAPGASSGKPAKPGERAPGKDEAAPGEPVIGPYVTQDRGRDWNVTVRIEVKSDSPADVRSTGGATGAVVPNITPFKFQSMSLVFPVVPTTASSRAVKEGVIGELTLNDQVADESPTVLPNDYPAGTKLAKWEVTGTGVTECRQVGVWITVPTTAYRTSFDETGATRLAWPGKGWPGAANSALQPQMYVDVGVDEKGQLRPYDDAALKEFVKRTLGEDGIADAKAASPVRVAKSLARGVWGAVQPTGEGTAHEKRTGELAGLVLQAPGVTLESGRGSAHDMTVLLAAAYKKAGLPARTVIGFDAGDGGDAKFLRKGDAARSLRSWVEFCVYDEAKNEYNWVPVDVARMRKVSSRPMSIDRQWKFFGTHDELDRVVPFALHFHPPTDVVAYGSAGFWGWFVTPTPPAGARQTIDFGVTTQAKRGGSNTRDDDRAKPEVKRGGRRE